MWPFTEVETPTDDVLKRKQELVNYHTGRVKSDPNNEKETADLGRAHNDYATTLRDAKQFEQALHQCQNAILIWEKLDRKKAIFVAEMTRASILAQSDQKDQAMRAIETLLEQAAQVEEFEPYIDTLLLHRAGVFYSYGQPSLATKDLDLALMIREKRTNKIDETILEYRNNIFLMDDEISRQSQQ